MSEHYELTLADYLEVAKRRWLYLLLPFLGILAVSAAVAIWMPPTYESHGTIMIETQQIPADLIKSTVTSYADERIQIIQQLVMTRDNLLRIARKFNVFGKDESELTPSEQVDLMREKIAIAKVSGDSNERGRRTKTTIAFSVGFEDRSPELAVAVANELVTLFLSENVRSRTERASETTEFLTQTAADLKRSVEEIEAQIAQYKQDNSEALPEHLDLHLKMLERTEASLVSVEREIKAAQDERRFLEIEVSAIRAGLAGSGGQSANLTTEQQLVAAEAELNALKGRYSDRHPDVRRQAQLVEELRASLSEEGSGSEVDAITAQNIDISRAQARLSSVDKRISSLRQQSAQLETRRKELEAIVIQTPQVQRSLLSMERDYENTLRKYNEIQAKEMEARLAENLEQDKKAERFTLLEPPIRPEKPIKPDRGKIVAMGFFLAVAGAVGLVMLLEGSDSRIRSVGALTAVLGHRPLVTVPFIEIEEARALRKKRIKLLAVAGAVVALAAMLAVHFLYMPLDILLLKIMARVG